MRRRTTSYDNSYVGSSRPGLKSEKVRKGAPVTDLDVEDALRAHFLTVDLSAALRPQIAADAEELRITRLAESVAAGHISLSAARAHLRGAA